MNINTITVGVFTFLFGAVLAIAYFPSEPTLVEDSWSMNHNFVVAINQCAEANGVMDLDSWGDIQCLVNGMEFESDDFMWETSGVSINEIIDLLK